MVHLLDVLVGKLALRRGLIQPEVLQQHLGESGIRLGQVLVRRRLITATQLLELLAAADQVTLCCGRCRSSHQARELAPEAGTACPRCGGTLEFALDGADASDRFTTGRAGRRPAPEPTSLEVTRPESRAPTEADGRDSGAPSVRLRAVLGRDAGGGTTFGAFTIKGELGRGGMGVVYRAMRPGADRDVALKVLLAGDLASSTQVKRFKAEAERTARLDHPAIVKVHEVGQVDDFHYFTMDFVDGRPLNSLIRERTLGVRRSIEVARDVARGLEHAHARGVMHRDVKPANVIIRAADGRAVLTDFGLARDVDPDEGERLTRTGAMVGTPFYMSPEQAAGRRDLVGAPSDVWAVGVMLFEMLTFELPFQGETQLELQQRLIEGEPPRPSTIEPAIGADVEAIVLVALSRDLARRYPSAAALADDLDRALRGERVAARPPSALRRVAERVRRGGVTSVIAAVATLGLVGVLVAGVGWWRAGVEAERVAAAAAAHATALAAAEAEAERVATAARAAADERRRVVEAGLEAWRRAARVPAGPAYEEALDAAIEALTAGAAAAPDEPALRILRARAAERRAQMDLFRRDLEAVIAAAPSSAHAAEASYLLARNEITGLVAKDVAAALRHIDDALARIGAVEGPWRDVLVSARAFLGRQSDEEALAAVRRAIARDPTLAEAHVLEARILALSGKVEDGLRAAERAVAADVKDPRAWVTLAQLHGATEAPQRAIDDLARALEIDPRNGPALELRATINQLRGKPEESVRDLRQLLQLRGEEPDLLFLLAQAYQALDKPGQADPMLARLEAVAPADPRPTLLRMARHLEQVDIDGAVAEVRRALAARPDEAPDRAGLEDLLRRLCTGGHREAALREYARERRAVRPDEAHPLVLEAEAELFDGQHAQGFALLDEALRRFPDDLDARALRAHAVSVYRKEELAAELERLVAWAGDRPRAKAGAASAIMRFGADPVRARRLAQEAVDADAGVARAHLILGILLADEGSELQRAVDHLLQAIDLAPDDADALASLGTLLVRANRLSEAQLFLSRALARDPLRDDVHEGLMAILLRTRRPKELLAYGQRALRLSEEAKRPPSAIVVLAMAQVYSGTGQVAQAVGLLQSVEKVLPHPDLQAALAGLYLETNQPDAARALVERVLAVAPDHPVAKEVASRLGPR